MTQDVSAAALNAFVDGELPPHEAAHIAALVATHPALAHQVAQLHQIKAALSGMPDDLSLPETPLPQAGRNDRFRALRLAIAGSAAVLAFLWSAPLTTSGQQEGSSPLALHHDHWVATGLAQAQATMPAQFIWLEPVMQASGLTLVHHAQTGNVQHFGFKGMNDCRLSLFITERAAPATPLRLSLTHEAQQAHWQHETAQFDMIARDMAPARFATVATGLHRDSHAYRADEGLHLALQQAARLPCSA